MCRAWLGSKAQAWARLETARACKKCKPGPSRGLMAGSGPARAQARAWHKPGLHYRPGLSDFQYIGPGNFVVS